VQSAVSVFADLDWGSRPVLDWLDPNHELCCYLLEDQLPAGAGALGQTAAGVKGSRPVVERLIQQQRPTCSFRW
jgi:hypothetical protein